MNLPEIIYKYRNWSIETHQRSLKHNELFLSSPKDFNDPFDCKISTHYLSLDTPEKVKKYIEGRVLNSDLNITGLNKLEERLNNIQHYWDMFQAIEFSMIDKNYGILSLSSRWDSILMWSHYSNYHKGFCIGFNELKLRNSGLFSSGGLVQYSDEFPIINPSDDDNKTMFYQTLHKAKDWEYEQEYRLMKLFFPQDPKDSDRLIKLDDDIIEEVNLGMKINEEDKNQILDICRKKNIKVFQTYPISYKFKLERVLLK